MRNLGLYYSAQLDTIIIGFEIPGQYSNRLYGRVIGHTNEKEYIFGWQAFNVGYKYSNWHEGFVYIGRYTTYSTLKGYLDFINTSTTEQIEFYFKCKKVVNEYMNSFIVLRKYDGGRVLERHYKK